jgi:hypothetical protein
LTGRPNSTGPSAGSAGVGETDRKMPNKTFAIEMPCCVIGVGLAAASPEM